MVLSRSVATTFERDMVDRFLCPNLPQYRVVRRRQDNLWDRRHLRRESTRIASVNGSTMQLPIPVLAG